MKMHIKDFAELTGVSVRTLHYYDEIGLLKPSSVDEQNGYRFYDERCLERMQEILFYRELDFPLKDIQMILFSPDHDKQAALKEQKCLLTLKKERLERLIAALDSAMKGADLSMNIFDNSEFEAKRGEYAKEAKEKWGATAAYKATPHKARLSALHTSCLHLFRHIARKLLEIREYSCVAFVQSDEKSDCAIRIQSLCGAAIKNLPKKRKITQRKSKAR